MDMDFKTRFGKLNDNQKQAVEEIDGPLLVIAGPGTGKTELLSMRAAEILKKTDTLPSSILCLTFTESGATNMRQRLRQIIGEDAYKIAIHTFHSFGVEIINQNREYFFRGSEFMPADELAQYQILEKIFNDLDWNHPLATKNQDSYVYLGDVRTSISEFKKSGLSTDELRQIINENQKVIDLIGQDIAEIFSSTVSKKTIEPFGKLAQKVAEVETSKLPDGISSYSSVLALSIVHAFQEALETNSTKPVTAWKNTWCTKDEKKITILKDQKQTEKLLAAIDIYEQYETAMNQASLYDYDDMILNVINAVEGKPDLKANLQEQFHYIMVDEFQDTNLAQLRLLFNLAESPDSNIMAVGDDDQAIFSFQGADIGNIQRFREKFDKLSIIVLTDNYRSTADILTASRKVITQGEDRLENTIEDISKELTPHSKSTLSKVELKEYSSIDNERAGVAGEIKLLIDQGVPAETITVIARQHKELIELLPYLQKEQILVNYERRDNALDHPVVEILELMIKTIVSIKRGDHDQANSLLPTILAHPGFSFSTDDIWKLSLASWRGRQLWLESMQANPTFKPFADWLIELSMSSSSRPLEEQIDTLLGANQDEDSDKYISPLKNYFFSEEKLAKSPDTYLDALEALRTVRDKLREHYINKQPNLEDFLAFIDLYRQLGAGLTVIRHRTSHQTGQINLMTAHKSKGLEFDHVFIIGAVDNAWGEKVRSRSSLIRYPANLPLEPVGNTYDERLRLFFVAMTRAKQALNISFSVRDNSEKDTLIASFLSSYEPTIADSKDDIDQVVETLETDWTKRLSGPVTTDLKELLASVIENYKLSVTHLNNFLDVSRGGPESFLINNLLRFPQAKSAAADYGTAMHAVLQNAHNKLVVNGSLPSDAEILDDFSELLKKQHLTPEDFETYNDKGRTSLQAFLSEKRDTFLGSQVTELSFANQGAVVGEARLTGALDLADIDKQEKTIFVTDYKTGKPSRDWKGKTDYEKIKLHKYRQQLMFYQILVENSRDYSNLEFTGGRLQFVEPDMATGDVYALDDKFSEEDLGRFKKLIEIIWQKITTLDLPDTSQYEPNYKGMVKFEKDLLDIN